MAFDLPYVEKWGYIQKPKHVSKNVCHISASLSITTPIYTAGTYSLNKHFIKNVNIS